MRVPYTWLREFLEPRPDQESRFPATSIPDAETVREIVDALNDLGMVVEGVEPAQLSLDKVVVAQVEEIQAIPGADHIRRVLVRGDSPDLVEVVCGAYNFSEGDLVPFAKVGAILPGGFEISRRKMKGVPSNGMLCSARELELAEDASGLMILDPNLEVGQGLADALHLFDDLVFDLAIEANRPDANCVMGVARDLAPRLAMGFKAAVLEVANRPPSDIGREKASLIQSSTLCRRLMLAELHGPFVLKDAVLVARRLRMCAMRSISPVVDASNYVMLELGQPTHPYDLKKLSGSVVGVREAREGERVLSLDGTERVLRAGGGPDVIGDIVIVDSNDDSVGVAGIMGGASSEITAQTSEILLELATFTRQAIARTSKRLGLRTEASARFERGVDPEIIPLALQRFAGLLGSPPVSVTYVGDWAPVKHEVQLRLSRVKEILGLEISPERIIELLTPIGFKVEERAEHLWIEVPSFRMDCEAEIDIIEEVARHFGYENIGASPLKSPYVGRLTRAQQDIRKLRTFLRDLGYHEIIGAALVPSNDGERVGAAGEMIAAENPLATNESVLRISLLPTMLRALRTNLSRRVRRVNLFELGHVYSPAAAPVANSLPDESVRLGILTSGGENPVAGAVMVLRRIGQLLFLEDLDIKALEEGGATASLGLPTPLSWPALHGGRSGLVVVGGTPVGIVGEIPKAVASDFTDSLARERTAWIELDVELLVELSRSPAAARDLSNFTSSDLDLSFELDEAVSASDLCKTVTEAAPEIVTSAEIFDVFTTDKFGPHKKALGVRLRLESLTGTISDEMLSQLIASVETAVAARLGGSLRSA